MYANQRMVSNGFSALENLGGGGDINRACESI